MKNITKLYRKCFKIDRKTKEKTYLNPTLTKEELQFLYEVNSTIEGFGYQKDPRVRELRHGRNVEEDMLIVFDCEEEQIARAPNRINENTKAYFGPIAVEDEEGDLLPEYYDIFQKLPDNLNHIYTSFPENKIRRENVEIGRRDFGGYIRELEDKNVKIDYKSDLEYWQVQKSIQDIEQRKIVISSETMEFLKELVAGQINITINTNSFLKKLEFVSGKNPEEATLIRLTVADLGFKSSATTNQVYERAQILGLELCPADTGPNYRLKYRNQPLDEEIHIGMKQIDQSIFWLVCDGNGSWLFYPWLPPAR